jgi:uncharacterized metal-binding protein YceD (DUF177 family)
VEPRLSVGWDKPLRLHELAAGPVTLRLKPSDAQRQAIAKALNLESLPALSAEVTVKPWLDGAEVTGRFHAVVEQICGVTLDPFEQPLEGEIFIQAVPAGSPNAPSHHGDELELDPDSADPPDVLDGDAIDLAALVLEHLALEIDPFPKKPGAEFDYQPPQDETSPFAALKKLQPPKP